MTDDDDAALAWAGDEPVAEALEAPPVAEASEAQGEALEAPIAPTKTQIPAPLLITYGILAGLYLIYTIGWVITITRSTTTLPTLLGEIMFQLGEFLAIASPAVWFAAVVILTRRSKPIIRLLLLLAGLVATIPWPFLLGV